jgi:hypothetical protein
MGWGLKTCDSIENIETDVSLDNKSASYDVYEKVNSPHFPLY